MNFNQLIEQFIGAPFKVKFSIIALILMSILPFLSTLGIFSYATFFNEQVQSWDQTMILIMGVVVFFLTSLSLASTTILSIACGYFYGWQAYPWLFIMFVAGTLFGYTISNAFDKNTIMGFIQMNPEMYSFVRKLQKNQRLMLFTMRLTPSLPFAVTNFFCAYINVPLNKYLTLGSLGIGLRLLATVWVGTQISDFNENLEDDPVYVIQKYVFLGIGMVLFLLLYYYIMREKDEIE
ncbi:MAG: VTT domain-containing protein [Cytophagaceae bacterium]|jgi:uncharacterized membrane protein YdjX (TVP38/TMEM64 family)|nr:VTT domain-containing protein [Cytophagaceae bacterium]